MHKKKYNSQETSYEEEELKEKDDEISSLKKEIFFLKNIQRQLQEELRDFWNATGYYSGKQFASSKSSSNSLTNKLSANFTKAELEKVLIFDSGRNVLFEKKQDPSTEKNE